MWPEATLQLVYFPMLSETGHSSGPRKPAWNQGCMSRERHGVSMLRAAERKPYNRVGQHARGGGWKEPASKDRAGR